MSLRPLGLIVLAGWIAASASACSQTPSTSPVTGKELDSPYLLGATSGSENYIHVFANAGHYAYHCKLHTTAYYRMGGLVIVSAQGSDSAFVTIFQSAFHPDTVTVKPGGQVRWQNFDDGTHHTVTSD